MASIQGMPHAEEPQSENEYSTFNSEFVTELSNKLEHLSPRNEDFSTIDLYDDRLHDMTASYSEISFDSVTSPPSMFGGSSGSSDLEVFGKIKTESEFKFPENTEYDNKRPNKLDIHRYEEKISRNSDSGQSFHKSIKDLHLEGTVTTDGDMVLFVAEDLENKIKLSSPISKKCDTPTFPGSCISTPSLYRQALMPQLPGVDPDVLNDLESEVHKVATSVDTLTENLAGILQSVSALTVECLETYRDAVCKSCDAVDSNIKSMYQLMAKCEELTKSMKPIYKLSDQIKGIKRLLGLLENAVNT